MRSLSPLLENRSDESVRALGREHAHSSAVAYAQGFCDSQISPPGRRTIERGWPIRIDRYSLPLVSENIAPCGS